MKQNLFIFPEIECPEPVEGSSFVYLLECVDGSFYCGCTNNLRHRITEHNLGEAAVWTKMRRPVRLVYFEIHESLVSARRRENQIKGWNKKKRKTLSLVCGKRYNCTITRQ